MPTFCSFFLFIVVGAIAFPEISFYCLATIPRYLPVCYKSVFLPVTSTEVSRTHSDFAPIRCTRGTICRTTTSSQELYVPIHELIASLSARSCVFVVLIINEVMQVFHT